MNCKGFASTLVLALVLAGCAPAIRRDVMLERTSNYPEWALKKVFDRDSDLFFTGTGIDFEDYGVADRIAKLGAMRNLSEQIASRIKSEMVQSVQRNGWAVSNGFFEDSVALTTEFLTVRGFMPVEDYRDKVELAENGRIRYRMISLYKIPHEQYKQLLLEALEISQQRKVGLMSGDSKNSARNLLNDVRKSFEVQP